MGKFKTNDVNEYFDEKERRWAMYDKLKKDAMPNDPVMLCERIMNLDRAYLDACENVIFEK